MATYVIEPGGAYTTFAGLFSGVALAPGDIVEVRASTPGGTQTYREQVSPPAADSGAAGNPVTIKARTGDTIVISGATLDDGTGWSDLGGNVWRKNIGTTQPFLVYFGNTKGTNDATPAALAEWTYTSPNLDVYSIGDPAIYYESIQYGQRSYCLLNLTGATYVRYENIVFEKENGGVANVYDTMAGSHYEGCTFRHARGMGARIGGVGAIINNCIAHDNTTDNINLNGATSFTATNNTAYNGTRGISLTGADNGVVTDNNCYDITGFGISIGSADGNLVRKNTISNIKNGLPYGSGGAGQGIYVEGSSERNRILKNTVDDCYLGICLGNNSGAGENLVALNDVKRSIVNSIMEATGSGAKANRIVHNSIYHRPGHPTINPGGSGHALTLQTPATKGYWANNYIYNVSGEALHVLSGSGYTLKTDYNIVYLAGGNYGSLKGVACATLAAWKSAVQADAEVTDLLGVSAPASANDIVDTVGTESSTDLRPLAGSSAINTAKDIGVRGTDINGKPVMRGRKMNRGAYADHLGAAETRAARA